MVLRFTMLASGSGGNACLIEGDGFGVLIDAGLGPRQLAERLAAVGRSWAAVHAVLLTHTHSDHWKDRTLAQMTRRGVPLFCHPDHHAVLRTYAPAFVSLRTAGLVRSYAPCEAFEVGPGMTCRAFPVRHDSGATFAFRIEGAADLFGRAASLAYASDLGTWDEPLAGQRADVDLLAVEFNHDVGLERASGRSGRLIARVLGPMGHLSNEQAAGLVRAVLARSPQGRLRHLVQLHLSEDCNRPTLAQQAAQAATEEHPGPIQVHTAEQDRPGQTLCLSAAPGKPRVRGTRRRPSAEGSSGPRAVQGWLPGLEPGALDEAG
jgi:phosphoribosyl 1,2-cyclic phosphodiesterase